MKEDFLLYCSFLFQCQHFDLARGELCVCVWVDGWESLITKPNQSRLENTVCAWISLRTVRWVGLEALWSGLGCASLEFYLPGKTVASH